MFFFHFIKMILTVKFFDKIRSNTIRQVKNKLKNEEFKNNYYN